MGFQTGDSLVDSIRAVIDNILQAHLDCVADPEGIKHEVEKIGDYAAFKLYHFKAKEYIIN